MFLSGVTFLARVLAVLFEFLDAFVADALIVVVRIEAGEADDVVVEVGVDVVHVVLVFSLSDVLCSTGVECGAELSDDHGVDTVNGTDGKKVFADTSDCIQKMSTGTSALRLIPIPEVDLWFLLARPVYGD